MVVHSRAPRREKRNIDGDWKHDRCDGKETQVSTSKPMNKRMFAKNDKVGNSDLFYSSFDIHSHL